MKLDKNIETPRLIIRSYKDGDRDFCLSLWCDSENGEYMADPLYENIDEKYLSYFDGMQDCPDGYYMIVETKGDGKPVGTLCMFPENDNYDIGYCVAKEYWRKGFGSEMIAAVIDFVKAHGGTSVTAEVADGNAASLALLHKFGFTAAKKTGYKKRNEEKYFDAHIMEKKQL